MDRAEAVSLLGRLHGAQQAFYTGGDEAPVRALLTVAGCWLLPLDPATFDDIWSTS